MAIFARIKIPSTDVEESRSQRGKYVTSSGPKENLVRKREGGRCSPVVSARGSISSVGLPDPKLINEHSRNEILETYTNPQPSVTCCDP